MFTNSNPLNWHSTLKRLKKDGDLGQTGRNLGFIGGGTSILDYSYTRLVSKKRPSHIVTLALSNDADAIKPHTTQSQSKLMRDVRKSGATEGSGDAVAHTAPEVAGSSEMPGEHIVPSPASHARYSPPSGHAEVDGERISPQKSHGTAAYVGSEAREATRQIFTSPTLAAPRRQFSANKAPPAIVAPLSPGQEAIAEAAENPDETSLSGLSVRKNLLKIMRALGITASKEQTTRELHTALAKKFGVPIQGWTDKGRPQSTNTAYYTALKASKTAASPPKQRAQTRARSRPAPLVPQQTRPEPVSSSDEAPVPVATRAPSRRRVRVASPAPQPVQPAQPAQQEYPGYKFHANGYVTLNGKRTKDPRKK